MYFIIGGDIVPTSSNIQLFNDSNMTELVGENLLAVMNSAQYRIFNLEVPITDKASPIKKQGPNLIAPVSSVRGLCGIKADLFTLANNHILDQGSEGLRCTIRTLEDNKINHVGAGNNLEAACAPFIFDFANKKIGVYACAEHEFSIATAYSAGANPFDPLYSLEHVEALRSQCDFLVVLYHGGKEFYRYPSPRLQKVCRRLVDKGANLVVCQHSHCIGCQEIYKNSSIVYGQGNFLFDNDNTEFWQTGLLLKVDDQLDVSYMPIAKKDNVVRLANEHQAHDILEDFDKRSEQIKAPGFVEDNYREFARRYINYYLDALSGHKSLVFKVLNKLTRGAYKRSIIRRKYRLEEVVRIQNYIECEAHRELLLSALDEQEKAKYL